MGKVRPDHVKQMARELVERFPGKFSVDFQDNKSQVDNLAKAGSKKLRNRIAGYIVKIMSRKYVKENYEGSSEANLSYREEITPR
jgi:small subunit ribosomal protein S17e